MINTYKLMHTVQLFANTDNDEETIAALNTIADAVLDDNVLKATVTVTRLLEDGTVTHEEINVDNESDMMTNHGFVANGTLENASDTYRLITTATATETLTTANEAHVIIGGDETLVLLPQGTK